MQSQPQYSAGIHRQLRSLVCELGKWGLVLLAAGCGGDSGPLAVAPVKGTVRYNGVPVRDAYVKFSQDGCPIVAGGFTDEMGRFELTSYQKGDGAPLGEHKVTITVASRPPPDTEFQTQQAEAQAIADPVERRKKLTEISALRKQGGLAPSTAPEPRSQIPKRYASPE